MKLDPFLIPLIKINSKSIKDLKVRPETIKFVKENTREKSSLLLVLAVIFFFFLYDAKSTRKKAKINNWGLLHQTKKFLQCGDCWGEEGIRGLNGNGKKIQ